VAGLLKTGLDALLLRALEAARDAGDIISVKVGPGAWPSVLARTVQITSSPPRIQRDELVVAFAWQAASGTSLFPMLDADFEVARFGSGQSMLAIRGSYDPPAGHIGDRADQLLCHRIAEATLRSFLEDIAAGIIQAVGAHTDAAIREDSNSSC